MVSRYAMITVLVAAVATNAMGQAHSDRSAYDWVGGSVRLSTSYNDNLFEYSPGDLDQFEAGTRPDKFSMERPQDLVTAGRIRLTLAPDIISKNPTQVRLRFNTSFHASNSLRNYISTGLEVRQFIWRKNFIYAGYSLLPRYYLRNISFRNLALPPRIWLSYAEVFLSRQTYTIGLGRNLTSKFTLSADYSYAYVRYNRELQERDSRVDEIDLDGSMRAFPWLRVDAGYHFSFATARGRELSDTLSDLTSRSHRADASANVYLRGLTGLPVVLAVDVRFEYQQYLSDKMYDPGDPAFRYGDRFHYGRHDRLWRMTGELSYDLTDYLELSVMYSWEQNRTNLTETADAGSYQTHIAGIGAEVSF